MLVALFILGFLLAAAATVTVVVIMKNKSLKTESLNKDDDITALNALIAEKTAVINGHEAQVNALNAEILRLKDDVTTKVGEYKAINERFTAAVAENKGMEEKLNSAREKLDNQKAELEELKKKFTMEFEILANKIFEEKTTKFTAMNKENLDAILKPLGENIDAFKKKVEETYDKESKQRFSLEERVKELVEQTDKVSSEANNLASALKGQTKKQGDWGEVILENILEKSGLVKGREYFSQENIKAEDGSNLRPDVMIHLPGNKVIIVDSKMSLVAYDRYCNAETPEQQAAALKEHLSSVTKHIDELAAKSYDNLPAALDFVMMFIPIEPAYLIAIQADSELWDKAYKKRILLISPTNLIACLKLISDLWRRDAQDKNAMEIVKRGEMMYEKFVTFTDTLKRLGQKLDDAQTNYSAAIKQLSEGSGNLVGQATKLKSLGLKSGKMLMIDGEEG
ncbi:MAG: DNA recombination protein RmuC [Bacteroidales bacterium]|nr:DNA recombination protein RmuC [Bacteroidales bacterium]